MSHRRSANPAAKRARRARALEYLLSGPHKPVRYNPHNLATVNEPSERTEQEIETLKARLVR